MNSRSVGVAVTLFILGTLIPFQTSQGAAVVLNEFNAVSSANSLDNGGGADSFFGKIVGNGGNWLELMIVDDHVDMRGWQLDWTEDETVGDGNETARGTITFSQDPIWSDLRSGSLVTVIETIDAGNEGNFSTATDISYAPETDDWWINVASQEEATKGDAALVTTVTNDGPPGDFSVGNSDWVLTIKDSAGEVVFGPVGEGAPSWAGGGISGREGGSLEGPPGDDGLASVAAWQAIAPDSPLFDDTGGTSFGAPNVDYDADANTFTQIQNVTALRNQVVPGMGNADYDADGELTVADIDLLTAAVLAEPADLNFDINRDGQLDGQDRTVWVEQAKGTYIGDSNLDGEFNSQDLVVVLTAGLYEDEIEGNATWATGDWNGDLEFTTSDFVAALTGGGFEIGPRAAAAVPEPSVAGLMLFALFALPLLRRGRS